MSQMPDKIWLHKDTKYNTGDTVCGYQYEFAQGIEDEGGIKNFVEYVPADAFIEKAEKYLTEKFIKDISILSMGRVNINFAPAISNFLKCMKGEQDMTQEDKELLLKDLCARLPYDIKVCYENNTYYLNEINPACKDIMISVLIQDENRHFCAESVLIEEIKPYLRSISSMTEEEKAQMAHDCYVISLDFEHKTTDMVALWNTPRVINWLLEHHFDYRGLIEKGLAIAVTEENNPYK